MSLRDTIEAARREAEGNVVGRPKREAEAAASESGERKGFSRSSAAKAKPAREAASSVRTGSSPSKTDVLGRATETKEEKRDRRRREREESDFRNRAYDLILRGMPDYRRTERMFWIVVGAGLVLAVISLACVYFFGESTDMSSWQGILSIGSLVGAYAFIIAGIVYDFVKRRPFRKQAQARVEGLSDKRLMDLYERESARQAAEKDAKEARKAKK